jgi:hypothetical protein
MTTFLTFLGRALDLLGVLFFLVLGVVGIAEWPVIIITMPPPAGEWNLCVGALLVAVGFAALGAFWLRGWLRAVRNVKKV